MSKFVIIPEEKVIALEENLHLYESAYNEFDELIEENYQVVDFDTAVEYRMMGYEDHSYQTDEAYKLANADPKFLSVKEEISKILLSDGWSVDRDKNGSVYFVKNDLRIRFSDHALGSDWTGRAQTGGADVSVEYTGQTAAQIIQEFVSELNDMGLI